MKMSKKTNKSHNLMGQKQRRICHIKYFKINKLFGEINTCISERFVRKMIIISFGFSQCESFDEY